MVNLSKDEDYYAYMDVAENPNTPDSALGYLVKYRDKKMRMAIVSHPNASVSLLKRMSKYKDEDVRNAALNRLKEGG